MSVQSNIAKNPMLKSIINTLFNMLKDYVKATPNEIDDFIVDILEISLKKLKIL